MKTYKMTDKIMLKQRRYNPVDVSQNITITVAASNSYKITKNEIH